MYLSTFTLSLSPFFFFFFFNDTATTEIYTLSLHDALPIFVLVFVLKRNLPAGGGQAPALAKALDRWAHDHPDPCLGRSEEHTSELQSQSNLVCRLLLEKKKKRDKPRHIDS